MRHLKQSSGQSRVGPSHLAKRALVLVVVAAAWTGLAPGADTLAKPPGQAGRLAFARDDPALGDTVTYTVNPDGTHLQQLFPGASESPHWSPDGTRVAILACADPPVCDTAAVLVNPDTGDHQVLRMPDPAHLFTGCVIWSPDASRLLCEGDGQSDPTLNGMYTIRSSDGGDLQRVTVNPGGVDSPIDYSPSGGSIVFSRTIPTRPAQSAAALFVVSAEGGTPRRITPWGFADDDGSWSPDGREIAFEHAASLFTVHPDGTDLRKIPLGVCGGRFFVGDFSWSPNGTEIAFLLISPTGSRGIATAHADGSDVGLVTTSPTFDHQADWGPHPIAR